MNPKLIVFASGTKDGGGSGFENLVTNHDLNADIVSVVSNHERGGVRSRSERLGVPFIHFEPPFTAKRYHSIVEKSGASWTALSGWIKKVVGLDPATTFNIHPALLSFDQGRFGGEGLYGHHVHEAVKRALDAGEIFESGLSMHFVTSEYDRGPIFFECRLPLMGSMTADDIAKAVNIEEHHWQPKITNMVVHREIRLEGSRVVVPDGYEFLPQL